MVLGWSLSGAVRFFGKICVLDLKNGGGCGKMRYKLIGAGYGKV
jgi:hypothetical protein